MASERFFLPRCSICDRPVNLETSKTDEYGNAIHEECAVIQVTGKKKLPLLNSFYMVPKLQPGIRKKMAKIDEATRSPARITHY
jgi:hypothetical protein